MPAEELIADPVTKAMTSAAKRLNAIAVSDSPKTRDKARLYRQANGNERLYIVHPDVKVSRNGAFANVPASAHVAGIFGSIDFWESPSNRELEGIVGLSRGISFALDDSLSEGQLLNSYQIAAIVFQEGFRLWGARGSGDPTDQKTNQIQKIRIRDAIKETLIRTHRWAVAMNIGKKYFVTVADGVNRYLASLQALGAIAGGRCWFEEEKNPAENLFAGFAHFYYEFTPSSVAERLTFEEIVTDKYLASIM